MTVTLGLGDVSSISFQIKANQLNASEKYQTRIECTAVAASGAAGSTGQGSAWEGSEFVSPVSPANLKSALEADTGDLTDALALLLAAAVLDAVDEVI